MSAVQEKKPEANLIIAPEEARQQKHLPTVSADATALMKIIDRAAMDPSFDVAKLQQLLTVRDQWAATEARNAYNVAFAAFKAEAVKILKNKDVTDGPLKGKKYAELHAVVNALTPALSTHDLSHSWKLTKDEKDWIEVTCFLKHSLGHTESVSMGAPPDTGGAKNPVQSRASTVSYLERYTLKAVTGTAEQGQDDDGNGGKGKRLAENVAADHLAAIDAAADDKSLIAAYSSAHTAAIDAEDMGALRLFTQHKDARKKAIKK